MLFFIIGVLCIVAAAVLGLTHAAAVILCVILGLVGVLFLAGGGYVGRGRGL